MEGINRDDNIIDVVKIINKMQKEREIEDAISNFSKQNEAEKQRQAEKLSQTLELVETERKLHPKFFAKGFVAGALVGALAAVGILWAYDRIENNIKIYEAESTLKGIAKERLIEEGLATRNKKGKISILDNKISDYKCLDLTNANLLETHIYKEVLGSEFADAIQTASYDNGGSYYIGIEQWYMINGFFDKDTKKASADEEFVVVKPLLLKAYENNCEGIIRTSEEIKNTTSRGRNIK